MSEALALLRKVLPLIAKYFKVLAIVGITITATIYFTKGELLTYTQGSVAKLLGETMIDTDGKIVVANLKVGHSYTIINDAKVSLWLVGDVSRGKTTCTWSGSENVVQYFVPFNSIEVDENPESVTLRMPSPVVDKSIVSIDPQGKMECDSSLTRLDSRSGENIRKEVRSNLKESLVVELEGNKRGFYKEFTEFRTQKLIEQKLRESGIKKNIIFEFYDGDINLDKTISANY